MKRSGTYTTIDNNILSKIKDVNVLGIYAYLKSLPPEKSINKESLADHFGLGINKIKSIFSKMNSYCLIDYVKERGEDGRITKIKIILN